MTAIARTVAASARHPILTIALVAAFTVWGWLSLREVPLDAVPDLSETQVIVLTEWDEQSPDVVEDQITYPISAALLSAPDVEVVRGQSFFGLSFVYVIFEEGTDPNWARSRVMETMARLAPELPDGVTPTLGPDATGVGWVFQYALVPKPPPDEVVLPRVGIHGHQAQHAHEQEHETLAELRALQDWSIRFALESVPGVAEVAPIGGLVRQYEVRLDPARLRDHGLGVEAVARAVPGANLAVGGGMLEVAQHETMIRGRGRVQTPEEIASTLVGFDPDGTPVLVRDLGRVVPGHAPRRGIAELDGQGEVVGGVVIMRYGENALDVITGVKERLEEIRAGLPEEVELVVTYDRSELIEAAIDTLGTTLIEEIVVVSVVIFLFLVHVRSALVPIVTLPVAVLLAFVPMFYQGVTASIMSLGGIAVAIGAMVDASIVLLENVHHRLSTDPDPDSTRDPSRRRAAIVAAMQEVAPSIFFSLLVLAISFLPVFTLQGAEGRLFRPLAFTKTYSLGFAAVLAVTLTPALAALLVRGRILGEDHDVLNRLLVAVYAPVVRFATRRRKTVIGTAAAIVVLTVPVLSHLDEEFMPPLAEGVILYMPSAPHGMPMHEAAKVLQRMDAELRAFPEVVSVFGKAGRAESATDPAPMGMMETIIVLAPRSQWREGLTWEALIAELDEKVRYPGMPNVWWMPIKTRTEMLTTGIRTPLGIQVFGDDIAVLQRAAIAIERAVAEVPGTRSAYAERLTGGFFLDIEVDREAAVRHGVRVEDVLAVVEAIEGRAVSETIEGRERYEIVVRLDPDDTEDPREIGRVPVVTGNGGHVPLAYVADIRFATGPPMIRSEDGSLVVFVFVDTERPIVDYVADAKQAVARDVDLPDGVRLGWAGQFEQFERAAERLWLVVPLTLALVVGLLLLSTRSLVETGIVLLAVPFSLVGALWLLLLLDYHLSVAVWVGLIALAGLDAETGVVMLLYLRLSHAAYARAGRLRTEADLEDAIVEGAAKRVRPKLMTVVTTMVGLVPILWSTGTGADVMKRIAAPMVGGLVSSLLLELTVYPAIFAAWKRRALRRCG